MSARILSGSFTFEWLHDLELSLLVARRLPILQVLQDARCNLRRRITGEPLADAYRFAFSSASNSSACLRVQPAGSSFVMRCAARRSRA